MQFSLAIIIFFIIFFVHRTEACSGTGGAVQGTARTSKDWWQLAQFYQIYPRSFMDSDGDGIGDLKGITSKLSYLKEIGVAATWLSPIYKSPMVDFGYDIADFFDIQPEYGTLEDFDNLIKEANTLGLKIILDFVPNHSSDMNEWFKKSVRREKGYEDYYVWHDGYKNENGERVPPSNWLQAFRGSAWEWNEDRQQYYLHQFAVQQPDLNYRNPAVVAQMKRVLTYWLDRGVAGFRVDAVPWCFEVVPDANGRYPDEPLSGFTDDKDDSGYLNHIYTQNQPETIDMVYQWRQLLDDYQRIHGGDTRVLMIEAYPPLDVVMKLYGNSTTQGAQIPFNFQFIVDGNADKNNTQLPAKEFVRIIDSWMNLMPAGKTPNWVMGNHDQRRVGSRYGEQRIDIMNMIQMFLPGVSVTYMGEEIGMLDLDISWEDTRDPAACNSNPQIYEQFTRDPCRTPFQWSNQENAGFSTNSTTWLPINPNYVSVNMESENTDSKSHLSIYKQLSELRKTQTLQYGDVKYGAVNDNILAIKRSLPGEKTYILLANVLSGEMTANVSNLLRVNGNFNTKIVNTISARREGNIVSVDNFILQSYEAIIVESP
ncbi:maltase A3-like [Teleopsis dalmanni]|uniref:maltase A3-like n=1 Tax=Teleopsis dalmanni TaxID=139649 RepID=UPI0018CF59EB|nr:maltase A3-like [Teleopsis dalmanni]XP_037952786.1 maltase A3-like [Teleopsis dalmanni]XP_037952911.1 maltase A3-like [Teleopsis dalmanni]